MRAFEIALSELQAKVADLRGRDSSEEEEFVHFSGRHLYVMGLETLSTMNGGGNEEELLACIDMASEDKTKTAAQLRKVRTYCTYYYGCSLLEHTVH